jgi:hypothetical protein
MNAPDTARCTGKEIPFGSAYTQECKTCTRSQLLEPSKHTVWMGPVAFTETCPYKINQGK